MEGNKAKQELRVIEIPHIPSARPRKRRIAQRKRDKAARGLITVIIASMMLNIALSALTYMMYIAYVLQAGG